MVISLLVSSTPQTNRIHSIKTFLDFSLIHLSSLHSHTLNACYSFLLKRHQVPHLSRYHTSNCTKCYHELKIAICYCYNGR